MCDINLSRPSKRSVECEKSSDSHTTKRQLEDVAPPSNSDLNCFFESISKAKNKPAILKITPPYSKEFIPTLSLATYPKPIMELYNPAALELRYHDLLTECEDNKFCQSKLNVACVYT